MSQNFVTRWDLSIAGSAPTEITFGTETSGIVNYTWQEISPGSASGSGSWNGLTFLLTGLPVGAIIRLEIEPANFHRFRNDYAPDGNRLIAIENWGDATWENMGAAFAGCVNLQVTATDVPDLSNVTDMAGMFAGCAVLNSPGNIGTWNTANITDMSFMFTDSPAFNQNIGSWNTAAVTTMEGMFFQATAFNQNIGSWNTAAVTTMQNMFYRAKAFDQDIGAWNTSAVTNMAGMFDEAILFDNGGSNSIDNWNTAAVTDMQLMFRKAKAFNRNIGSWNTGAVTNMFYMFSEASVFNQNIGAWNTSAVTTMNAMFSQAKFFNQDIGLWNTSAVTDMSGMFTGSAFNQDISAWSTGAVTTMSAMFWGAGAFNQDIGSWNTSSVTTMSYMFYQAGAFNQNLNGWNTASVTDMTAMFNDASSFNGTIGNWNVGSVLYMSEMFRSAVSFNQNIGGWNVSAAVNMLGMFFNASSFNQPIGNWDVSNVTRFESMFTLASSFNQDIGNWDVSSTVNLYGMFALASSFNQDLSSWNVSAVTNMFGMFASATSFNQNLGSWTIGNVLDMNGMLDDTGLSLTNYDATLTGWASQIVKPNVPLGAVGLEYCSGASARTLLVNSPNNWTITGDVLTCPLLIPTVISFTPAASAVGTTVTITGTNFSLTPAGNIVRFGATRATVTAATTSQLTVTVPAGATYDNISVLVNGLIAYSRIPFIPTFPGGGTIDACSFDSKTDFATGSSPFAITVADFDGDGKVDVAVANRASATINVYRNTSTTGVIDASSFASPLILATGTGDPFSLSHADLDGDGKTDIILTRVLTSNLLSIYRNISTSGNLSFDNPVDFVTGVDALNSAIGDLDADGKADIAVCNRFGNSISVFKNTSSPGGFTAGSFAAKVDFALGAEPFDIAVADLDGDNKPEVVTTNRISNTLSIFRNASTAGIIDINSFAAKVDLTTGSAPYGVASGDIDGDAKIDLVVSNNADHSISILRNKVTSGITAGSFESKVDFATGSSPGLISLSDVDGDGKVDVVIPDYTDNSVSVLKNQSVSGSIDASSLLPKIGFASAINPLASAVADLDGDGKSDLIATNTASNSFSVLRNLIGSVGPPSISSFTPSAGETGNVITINGTNFSPTSSSNIVTFNGHSAVVSASTTTSITTSVPPGATTGSVNIEVGCYTATSSIVFNVVELTITTQPNFTYACEESVATFLAHATGTSNITYQWQKHDGSDFIDLAESAGYSGTSANTLSVNTSITGFGGNGQYRCRINGDFVTEKVSSDAQLTINSLPSPPDVTGDSDCNIPSTLTLSATGASDGDYLWYDAGGNLISGETNSSYTTPAVSATTTYFVTLRDTWCESHKVPVVAQLVSITIPSVSMAAACGPASVMLTASGGSNGQYRWYTQPAAGSALSGEVNSVYTTPLLSTNATYYVSIDNGVCESSRVAATVNIDDLPAAPTTISSSACAGSPVPLRATGGLPGEFRWYTTAAGGTSIAGEANEFYSPTPLMTSSYWVSRSNGICESPRVEVVATIHLLPASPIPSSSSAVCKNSSISLAASGGAVGQYRWYDPSGALVSGETSASYDIPSLTSTATYQVAIYDGLCESPRVSIVAPVRDCTAPVISPAPIESTIGQRVTIDLTTFIADSEGDVDPTTLQIVELKSGAPFSHDGLSVMIDYSNVSFAGDDEMVIGICDLTGLCTQEKLIITVTGQIVVFNAVSDNGDASNDIFFIQYIDVIPQTKNNVVQIFNRWGDVVWETQNYDNVNRAFRGVSSSNQPLPSGTYFYKIRFLATNATRTGFLQLRR